ncbi:hypothetical protein [[Mycobacterium] fortunisiensis]|nr:hypothetical protein [[Mycobacterium] fortunisiensis]
MPTPASARTQADAVGRIAADAGAAIVRFLAGVARSGARTATHLSRAVAAVPPPVRWLAVAGLLILLGIVGAVVLPDTLGLVCIIVVIPVCSITLGALGHRWYAGFDPQPAPHVESPATASASDLQRSVEYVDKKLAVALGAFAAEHQQHAMIALFQAKTAVELTLGTEQEAGAPIDALLSVDAHSARPRIRVGAAAAALRESNSLAAS